ncbi:MAG: endonuclease/exonuclease/phosphatase family protein [Anaerolineae bacterium]|nr:endonuclease/exonuclease/phosphatase family protein [Anaerolineae bacterium]
MKFLTLNLRHNADRWPERRALVLDMLRAELPDVIAFQEVALPVRQADDIAEALNAALPAGPYRVFFEPKWQPDAWEGIALLSRLPVLAHERLELPGDGGRVAQCIRASFDGTVIDFANTHLHHRPIENESARLPQARRLLEWMARPVEPARRWLLAGDFNTLPGSETIGAVRQYFDSAYRAHHGAEPARTFPTPLVEGWQSYPDGLTIDYIFFDPAGFRVDDARVVGGEPHPGGDPTLYPSDHYGLVAEVSLLAR